MKFSAEEVFREIESQAPGFGVPANVARAFLLAENTADGKLKPGSTFNGAAVSPKSARGVFQTLPSTEAALQEQGFLPSGWKFSPTDLSGQVSAGLAALKEMSGRQKNPGDIRELGAMYNGGTAAWQNYLSGKLEAIPGETKNYWNKLTNGMGSEKPMGAQAIERAAMGGAASSPANSGDLTGTSSPGSTSSGSSSRSSIRTNVWNNPELFAQTMLSGAQVVGAGGSIDSAISALTGLAAQRAVAEQNQQAAIQQGAAAAGQATMDEYAISASNAARKNAILMSGQIHPDQANNRVNQAFDKINQLDFQLEPLAKEIDARMAVGLFDNPLEFIINQVRLPGMVGQYNAGVREQNRAIQSAQQIQSLAGTQQSLTSATDADAISRAGVSKAAAIAAQSQEALAKAQQEHAGAAARDAANLATLEGQKFEFNARMLQFTKEVQTATEGMSEREAAKTEMKMRVDKINTYLKMIGSTQQHTVESYKLMPTAEREMLFNAAGRGIIAPSFSEAATIIDEKGSLAGIAQGGDAATVSWFRKVVDEANLKTKQDLALATQQAKVTGKMPNKDAVFKANMDIIQERFRGEANDMSTASASNPLKLDMVAASKNPALAKNPVAVFVNTYGPGSANPVLLQLDEKKLFDRFTAAVTNGAMTPVQASQALHEFYTVGSQEQAMATKYGLFGIEKPKDYTVVLPNPGMFSFSRQPGGTVDMLKLSSIEQYLTKSIAVDAGKNFRFNQRNSDLESQVKHQQQLNTPAP